MNDKRITQYATRNTQYALPRWTSFVGIALIALASVMAYVGLTRVALGQLGFPLDDAWIHQTYARNLVELGRWAFVPGEPSAGSTAPLWTILLALAHLLPGDFHLWTYLFGATGLLMVGVGTWRLSLLLFGNSRLAGVTALFCLLEWHLVWAGASGMEITFFGGLALIVMARYLEGVRGLSGERKRASRLRPLQWGLLTGLLVMTRPEGLMLGAIIGGHMVLVLATERARADAEQFGTDLGMGDLLVFGFGALLVVGPYLLYNWSLSGTIFPNTYYAKQHEYRILLSAVPWWRRLFSVGAAPWIGAQVLLLPGLVYQVITGGQRDGSSRWLALLSSNVPLGWALLTILAYALRLPVTYQHGRYVMPVIPVLIVYGVGGTERLLNRLDLRLLRFVVALSTGALLVAFWVLGAQAYVQDVDIINCEMVSIARWLDANAPPDALIAAHDIGAIGYFTRRPLLDLAGLVNPEVIPILRDEAALQVWLVRRRADYLVTLGDWYTTLGRTADWLAIHRASCPRVQAAGKEDIVVYVAVR